MVKIYFPNQDITIETETGVTLAQCIRKAGLAIETPCNCIGVCGKCRVRATGGLDPASFEEKEKIGEETDVRLACMATVSGDAVIYLTSRDNGLKTVNKGFAIDVEVKGMVERVKLPVLQEKSPLPYIEQMEYIPASPVVYEKLADIEKTIRHAKTEWPVDQWAVVRHKELLDIRSGVRVLLGVAIDIGTTGVSAYLVDIETGATLSRASGLNPQAEYGGDVLTRISYTMHHADGCTRLKNAILMKINEMMAELLGDQYAPEEVYQAVIAGNTTMLHFLLGVSAESIAKAPYRPVFLNEINVKAAEVGIHINPQGCVTLLPSASGYVGADILAGIVATGFDRKEKAAIFVDIGTNGEIAANCKGRLVATSTAAGPALEGMNISCGCRAVEGAIDSVVVDALFNFSYTTIGGKPPLGICGSGLLDVMAVLVKTGLVSPNGRFARGYSGFFEDRLRDNKFYLTDEIYLTQKDIRQIQLAKGAIAAGITMLLEAIDTPIEDLEEVVIAGAFGYHVNPGSIKEIGLIPRGFNGEITFVGNSSAEGARLCLVNGDILRRINELPKQMEVMELSTSEKFQDYFIKALSF